MATKQESDNKTTVARISFDFDDNREDEDEDDEDEDDDDDYVLEDCV